MQVTLVGARAAAAIVQKRDKYKVEFPEDMKS